MMIPINRGNNVDLQHMLNFDLRPSMTAGQGHDILWFCEFLCLIGSSCVRFSSETTQPISPMLIPINWGNNVDVQRALHFYLDPHLMMTAGQGRKILRFWEFRCLTGSSLCSLLIRNYSTHYPMMIPINWGNNVDVQRALHFDPSMTAGQSHKILRFCEFRFLTDSRLCLLLLRNYLTKFSNADANLQREQCRFATYT